jgi:hypothetical protein
LAEFLSVLVDEFEFVGEIEFVAGDFLQQKNTQARLKQVRIIPKPKAEPKATPSARAWPSFYCFFKTV